MTPTKNTIFCGGNLEVVTPWPSNCIDEICTDPPYGLEFMGKDWDRGLPGVRFWREFLRITKPGGFLLCFGGTRTYHRLTCAIEDAGWEIRDCMMWLYGSGFPKSHNISKAIDKAKGQYKKGRVLPSSRTTGASDTGIATTFREKTAANPQTDLAQLWDGYGTALKPAWEPVLLCEKPLTLIHIFGIMIDEITDVLQEILLCQNLYVSDVERNFSAIRAKLEKEQVHTVHESARINVWENTANARYVANSFIFSNQELSELTKTKESSVLQSAKENGNGADMQEQEIPVGEVEDILTKVQDIYMSVIVGHIEGNIALLWKNISDELLKRTSKFTIKMVIKLITELRILRSYAIQTISKDTGNLSPEYRPIIVAMKPLDGTFAHNAEAHGVAGLNIDASKIPSDKPETDRWPANLVLDEEAGAMLDEQSGVKKSGKLLTHHKRKGKGLQNTKTFAIRDRTGEKCNFGGDSGGASRFFYCAKTSKKERNLGLDDQSGKKVNDGRQTPIDNPYQRGETIRKNTHPTVKPLALMKYLCTLLKMPSADQIILDPFMGSGTTGMACASLGIGFIGIEKEREYCEISAKRIAAISGQTLLVMEPTQEIKSPAEVPHSNLSNRQKIINAACAELRRTRK